MFLCYGRKLQNMANILRDLCELRLMSQKYSNIRFKQKLSRKIWRSIGIYNYRRKQGGKNTLVLGYDPYKMTKFVDLKAPKGV